MFPQNRGGRQREGQDKEEDNQEGREEERRQVEVNVEGVKENDKTDR